MADDVFLGYDISPDGASIALCRRNPDGTLALSTVYSDVGDDCYAYGSGTVHLDAWSQLTLDVWAAHRELAAEFDRLEDFWGDWIRALPCDGPFDWMSWAPWTLLRHMMVPPNPFLPDPPQYPRYWNPRWTLTAPGSWVLPDYDGPVLAPGAPGSEGFAPHGKLVMRRSDEEIRAEIQATRNRSWRDIVAAAGLVDDSLTLDYRRPTSITEALEAGQGPDGRLIDCTCSPSRYDGDDGWDRDCPEHGAGVDPDTSTDPDDRIPGRYA